MKNRIVAGGLWLYAGWYLGSMIAYALSVPDALGPILGATCAFMIAVDPFKLLWNRSARATARTDKTSQGSLPA